MFACLIRRGLKQLLVRNLDANVKPHQIKGVFQTIGAIKEFDMPYDSKNLCNKGYAFIEYSDPEDNNKAIMNFHKKKLFANYIKVLLVQDDEEGATLKKYEFPTRTEYVNHSHNKEKIMDLGKDNFS